MRPMRKHKVKTRRRKHPVYSHNKVRVSFYRANAAIAVPNNQVRWGVDPERHCFTMATPGVPEQRHFPRDERACRKSPTTVRFASIDESSSNYAPDGLIICGLLS